MASNFRIQLHRDRNNVHLNLVGDFDGSSAHELINMLEDHYDHGARIFVHTASLKTIYPFGREVFQNNISGKARKLVFTGQNGHEIAPEQ